MAMHVAFPYVTSWLLGGALPARNRVPPFACPDVGTLNIFRIERTDPWTPLPTEAYPSI